MVQVAGVVVWVAAPSVDYPNGSGCGDGVCSVGTLCGLSR